MQNSVITISRQYGSGGRQIGLLLAKRLGIPFYDKEIIELTAKQSGMCHDFLARQEQTNGFLLRDFSAGLPSHLPLGDKLYLAQYSVIRTIAEQGPCVIVGRGAGSILKDCVPLLNIFVYTDIETRKRRAIEEYGDSPRKIEKRIADIDKKRTAYFRFYTGADGRQMENYHFCIDSGRLGIDGAVTAIEVAYLVEAKQTAESRHE